MTYLGGLQVSEISAERKEERDQFDRKCSKFAAENMSLNAMMEEIAEKLKHQVSILVCLSPLKLPL